MNDQKRSPLFCTEIHSGGFISHPYLFLDGLEQILNDGIFPGSHIYYLTFVPKIRFAAKKCTIIDSKIFISFSVLQKTINTEISLTNIHPFKSHNFSCDALISLDLEVKQSSNSSKFLSINSKTAKDIVFDLTVDTILASCDVNFDFKPEIVYVGQSFDLLNRWKNHQQINKANSIICDDYELRLYFIHFTFIGSFESVGDKNFKSLVVVKDRDSREFRDRISVVEQALIQYYRPILNSQHLDGNVNTAAFKRIIRNTGLKTMGLSLGMNEHAFQFFSPNQVLNEENVILKIKNGKATFVAGLCNVNEFLD